MNSTVWSVLKFLDIIQWLMMTKKRIRKWIYRDHYYPGMTGHDHSEHEKHAGKGQAQFTLGIRL